MILSFVPSRSLCRTGLLVGSALLGVSAAGAQGLFPTTGYGQSQGQAQNQGQNGTAAATTTTTGVIPVPVTTGAAPSASTLAQPLQSNAVRSYSATQWMTEAMQQLQLDQVQQAQQQNVVAVKPAPSEFESYVALVMGRPLPRFGASLLVPATRDFTPPPTATVPPDYVMSPGDTLLLGLSGSVEATISLVIDNDGRVFIPQVGAISVAGARYGDLPALLRQRIGRQFRDFRVAVTVAQLRGIRVYVTGYATRPGAYTVNSLSTLVNAVLAAGGPTGGGSFRSIQLRRNGRIVSNFDLYDLLLQGDKSHDVLLQNEDVINIAPVGPQVAVTGSVNNEAIYEARPGETVSEVLRYAGGVGSLADPTRVIVSQLSNLDRTGWEQIDLAAARNQPIVGGDILRILSVADLARPLEKQAVLVKIEGEVQHPGYFYLSPGATISELMAVAGGTTPRAFVYGTELDRVSVQQQQQKSFDEALREIELTLTAAPLVNGSLSSTTDALRTTQLEAATKVVEQLRTRKPDGRVVLSLPVESTMLPGDYVLENNDRIYIPPRPTTVGVFGAVFRQGSFNIAGDKKLNDYLFMAGGPQRIADRGQVFIVHANGEVVPRSRGGLSQRAIPGDIIYVPVKTRTNSVLGVIRDVTAILFQFGLAAAAVAALQ